MEKSFKIIPVIDILNSEVVHAIRGERKLYKPLKSYLLNSSNPIEVIKHLHLMYNFKEFYIADLDSIINDHPNFDLYEDLLKFSNIKIMIDPGIKDKNDLLIFSKFQFGKLILGLETLINLKIIKDAVKLIGLNQIILSIDLYKGKILTDIKGFKKKPISFLMKKIKEKGIKELILLDLFRVGQKLGGIPPLYLEILNSFNGDIFVGGGIKNYEDILNYKKHNFSGVLIATALYDGSLKIEKLKNF